MYRDILIFVSALIIGFNMGYIKSGPSIIKEEQVQEVKPDTLGKIGIPKEIVEAHQHNFDGNGIIVKKGNEKVLYCTKTTNKASGPFEVDTYTMKYIVEEKEWQGHTYARYSFFPEFAEADSSDRIKYMGEKVPCDDGTFNDSRK